MKTYQSKLVSNNNSLPYGGSGEPKDLGYILLFALIFGLCCGALGVFHNFTKR